MGPTELLALVTVVFTGAVMLMCWLFADKVKKR